MMKNFPDIPGSEPETGISLSNLSGKKLPVTLALLKKTTGLIEAGENIRFAFIELIYLDEQGIININREYLKRSYVTDIITFRVDEDDSGQHIEGTIFCCAQRIEEQSAEYGSQIKEEYLRIFIHGLLHLAGYDDQTAEEKQRMTSREDHYLEQLSPEH